LGRCSVAAADLIGSYRDELTNKDEDHDMLNYRKLGSKSKPTADETRSAYDDTFITVAAGTKATIEQQSPEINASVSELNSSALNADIDLIHLIENMNKSDAFTRLDDLAELSEKTFFEIGGVLSKISKNKWFDSCPSFEDWITKNTTYRISKARALIQVYDAVVAAELPWVAIKDIGWTKLRAFARVLTKDNAEHWLGIAKSQGKLDLIEQVKKHLVTASEGTEPKAKPATEQLVGLKKKLMSLDVLVLATVLAEVLGNLDKTAKDQVIQAISSSSVPDDSV
jgi:hypothetical protein